MENDNELYLPFDAFLRSFKLTLSGKHAFLLGAGCSISSGLPSAQQCIWDWKKAIYSSRNKVIAPIFDVRQESVQNTIQRWLDSTGEFPPLGDSSEYERYVEIAYPLESDRREYFAQLSRNAKPAIGYKLLIELFRFGRVSSIWSTNFDGLVERAAHKVDVSCVNINIDTADLIYSRPTSADLLYVALHGDYKFSSLKNSSRELDNQVESFQKCLQSHLSTNTLVVLGYSGRDKSLMSALKNAFSQPGSGKLFWIGYGNYIPESVRDLIIEARNNKRDAFFVPSAGFDEVMLSIMENCFYDDLDKRTIIENIKNQTISLGTTVSPVLLNTGTLFNSKLKFNLYPLQIPKFYYQIDTTRLDAEVLNNLKEILQNYHIVCTPSGNQLYALGTLSQLTDSFKISSPDTIEQVQMPAFPLSNSILKNLLTKAVIFGITSLKPNLQPSYSKRIIWDSKRRFAGKGFEGVRVNLFHKEGDVFLLTSFSPTIYFIREDNYDKVQKQNIVRKYIDGLRNKEFDSKISNWENMIFGGNRLSWNIPIGISNISNECNFTLGNNSAFGGIYDPESVEPKFTLTKREIWSGKRLSEPKLLFVDKMGESLLEDSNPMRGLSLGQPLERILGEGHNYPIYLGVICPISYSERLHRFLLKLNQSCNPRYNDYIQPYPGFENAYSTPLDIPSPNDKNRWIKCNDAQQDARVLASKVCEFSKKISENYPNFTVIIFIPNGWESLKEEITSNEAFNLHNYVKAFGAQSRITTQFIEEKTLSESMDCEKRWWLSLALFVKAQRLPWSLTNLNYDTTYAGIGFSIDQRKAKGEQLVIGCSHLYNNQGHGLKYKLRQVENPLWIDRKNPYLSENEAYKFGLSILDLFHESMERFPKRVVIHKRTPFQPTEINGLRKSLAMGGVTEIDLISITEEANIKAVSQIANSYGIYTDGYPLKRGVCIQISNQEILLWTHGSVPSVQQGRLYYAGGRAIPSPLRIKRCYGSTDIEFSR